MNPARITNNVTMPNDNLEPDRSAGFTPLGGSVKWDVSHLKDPANRMLSGHLKPVRQPKTSKYRGVSFEEKQNCWRTQIRVDGKQTLVGRFKDEQKAAMAYNIAAKSLFGDSAYQNVILQNRPSSQTRRRKEPSMKTTSDAQKEPAEPRSVQRMVRCPACVDGKMKMQIYGVREVDGREWPTVWERTGVCALCMGHGEIDKLKLAQFERNEIELPPYAIPEAPNEKGQR